MADFRSFQFGDYRLDVGARQLFRGNTEVHVSPKAFDLLHALVEHRTRAVSKTELHDRLWPGTFVTEANLASLVAELRRALADPARSSKVIRTVHRFGYAFCGQVAGDAADRAPASHTSWIVWRGEEIPLRNGENIIGRDPGASVRIDFPSVSRRHARLDVLPDGVTVEDLGSKNGTLVKQARISGKTPLADLDELQVGSARMIVRIMHGSEPTQTS
ncbi:MAG TPA: winged helix-turn-helix domain-containing protein [Vicinamibacterales bacterium]|nr:winged helix-turn-helix domain-containing protein [Vicinamibacterales bacterium]